MDGLSVAGSIIAVIQITGKVIKYLNDVNNAPKECRQCTIEASNLHNLLINFRYRCEEIDGTNRDVAPWYDALRRLAVENGPLDQYKGMLEELLGKVELRNSGHNVKRRLSWTFSKAEAASILQRMERLKTLISIALEMDHLQGRLYDTV